MQVCELNMYIVYDTADVEISIQCQYGVIESVFPLLTPVRTLISIHEMSVLARI
jgi:hypothetical protein